MKKSVLFFFIFLILFSFYNYSVPGINTSGNNIDNNYCLYSDSCNDSLAQIITGIMKEVNDRAAAIDLVHSEGEVYVKSKTVNQNGEIEIKAKKKDDFWFRIWGSLAFVSKDAFIAHFNRNNFTYFNNLDDKVIEGPSTDENIGYITRIKCSFDDMMNALTGTVNIPYNRDTISYTDDDNYYMLTLKSGKIRKYWIKKSNYQVDKYVYLNKQQMVTLSFEFSNYMMAGNGQYAKKVEITKGTIKVRYTIKEISLQQNNLSFNVDFPSGIRKVKW
jgi:hypothetical protein